MLFQNNPYQQSVYLTSASRISSSVYKLTSSVTSYFNLQSINADLQQRNALLEMEVINLKHRINDYRIAMSADSINLHESVAQQYEYKFAKVINNSV